MNWAENHPKITLFRLAYADQYNTDGGTVKQGTMYILSCQMWVKEKWKSCVGEGKTVTEAMEKWGLMWKDKDYDNI